jgi:excisionase family DNA binding protein
MADQIKIEREYMTTPEAARLSGLSKNYLATLLRRGKLEGFRLARDWLIYTDSLEAFLATTRKPGPKGPRKQSSQQTRSSIATGEEKETTT